jgi:hypothetical protein
MKCAACGNDTSVYPCGDGKNHWSPGGQEWTELKGTFTRALDSDDANLTDSDEATVKLYACGRCGTVRTA